MHNKQQHGPNVSTADGRGTKLKLAFLYPTARGQIWPDSSPFYSEKLYMGGKHTADLCSSDAAVCLCT